MVYHGMVLLAATERKTPQTPPSNTCSLSIALVGSLRARTGSPAAALPALVTPARILRPGVAALRRGIRAPGWFARE
eukprot:6805638-Pyramimonas_sp.AAC.1